MAATSNVQRAYEFQANLEQHIAALEARVTEAYRYILYSLFENIVVGGNYSRGTPRDLGFAINSWVVGLNGVGTFRQPPEMPEDARRTRQAVSMASLSEGQAALLDVKLSDEVHLTSNCAYMGALEDGHSDQAPTGFIWLAIHAGPQIVNEVVREMLSTAPR